MGKTLTHAWDIHTPAVLLWRREGDHFTSERPTNVVIGVLKADWNMAKTGDVGIKFFSNIPNYLINNYSNACNYFDAFTCLCQLVAKSEQNGK